MLLYLGLLTALAMVVGPGWRAFPDILSTFPGSTRDLTEEHAFQLGVNMRYRDIYLQSGPRAVTLRRVYGTTPFDLPSTQSCLDADLPEGEAPTSQRLAWDRLTTESAILVCLVRTLNRFSDSAGAVDWLQRQGLTLVDTDGSFDRLPRPDESHAAWFGWTPDNAAGPHGWWNALSWVRRGTLIGLVITVEVYPTRQAHHQLDNPAQPPPYFSVSVSTQSRFEK